jgi:Mrp family chromosome partitioning ATPase
LIELLARRWGWLLLGGAVLACAGAYAGLRLMQTSFTAQAQLIYYESPNAAEVFRPRPITLQTLASQLRAPELLQRIGAQMQPPISAAGVAASSRLTPERGAEVVGLAVWGADADKTVELANTYARDAVRFTQEAQAKDAAEVNRHLQQQLAQTDTELRALQEQWRAAPRPAPPGLARSSPLLEKLEDARQELALLQVRYTDAWPKVQEQKATIAALEKMLAESGSQPAASSARDAENPSAKAAGTNGATTLPLMSDAELESLGQRLQVLEAGRLQLLSRQRAAQEFVDNAPGFFRVLAPASPNEITRHDRRVKVVALAVLGGLLGVLAAFALNLLVELAGRRLKNAADLERVTGLPLLASLGDLSTMRECEREQWAFRAWTILQGRLARSPNHGLVCGFISSSPGEGRSTWVDLLARAASAMGFRVLTVNTRPAGTPGEYPREIRTEIAEPPRAQPNGSANGSDLAKRGMLALDVLASPMEVTQRLTGPNSQPVVHIPLPGWVWNIDRRKQWQDALNQWRKIDNVVILVELPPASVPESVLLGENVPQLVWLARSGKADAADTRAQLETLRHARANLVGAVLNRAPNHTVRKRFARWVSCGAVCSMLAPMPASVLQSNQIAAQDKPSTTQMNHAQTGNGFPPGPCHAIDQVRDGHDQAGCPPRSPSDPGRGRVACDGTGRASATDQCAARRDEHRGAASVPSL